MGRAGCPGREKDCLKSVGTGVGVSARTYDLDSLEDRVREGPGSEHRHGGNSEGNFRSHTCGEFTWRQG